MRRILFAIAALLALASPAASQQTGSPTNPFYTVPTASTGGAASLFKLIAANSNNSTLISTGTHTVYGAQLAGLGSAPAYLKIYDKATAPTCGTDTPVKVLMIPAAATAANGAGSNVSLPYGVTISLGLGICVVTGIADNDNTSVASATFIINIDYK